MAPEREGQVVTESTRVQLPPPSAPPHVTSIGGDSSSSGSSSNRKRSADEVTDDAAASARETRPATPTAQATTTGDGPSAPHTPPSTSLSDLQRNLAPSADGSPPLSSPLSDATNTIDLLPPIDLAMRVATPAKSQVRVEVQIPSAAAQAQPHTSTQPPAKKQKLSPGTKEAKERERRAREQQKAEERARKEEERRKREEERARREAERKQRDELREQKRRAREEEQRARDEEKRKKEKSQMRLNAFFTKPKSETAAASGAASLPLSGLITCAESPRPASDGGTKRMSDYETEFQPFFLQSHTLLFPSHRFQRDDTASLAAQASLDSALQSYSARTSASSSVCPALPAATSRICRRKPRSRRLYAPPRPSVREIVRRLYEPDTWRSDGVCAVAADNSTTVLTRDPMAELFRHVPLKVLHFAEDVRPPYQGTFSRPLSAQVARRIARNPFYRGMPDVRYDYDSEAEWEDVEEGEDLDSDDGDEEMDEDDEDMDEFLDDEDEELAVSGGAASRRRPIAGDLEPVCSGLMVEGQAASLTENAAALADQYRLEVISEDVRLPIDPYSTVYWDPPADTRQGPSSSTGRAVSGSSDAASKSSATATAAGGTLHLLSATNTTEAPASAAATPLFHALKPGPTLSGASTRPRRPFPPEQLDEFKQVIQGSDLTKAGLIEVLKKRFPRVSKDVIRDTLSAVAVRHGLKEADKRWRLM